MLLEFYFGPYEIIRRRRTRPWFLGVSKSYASHVNGLVFQSGLVALILYSVYFNLFDDSRTGDHRYLAILTFLALIGLHQLILSHTKLADVGIRSRIASALVYGILIWMAVVGWRVPTGFG
jgi:hypothetical protein